LRSLSVFQCRLSRQKHAELIALLDRCVHRDDDRVMLMDLDRVEQVTPCVVSLGKTCSAVERAPVLV
jgi:CRISPR-associated protein Cas2